MIKNNEINKETQQRRVRGRCFLLEYPGIIPYEKLTLHLGEKFKQNIETCKYLFKHEHYMSATGATFVLLDFQNKVDKKPRHLHLLIDGILIEGFYKAVFDKEMALSFILKSTVEDSSYTNYPIDYKNSFFRLLHTPKTCNSPVVILEKTKKDNSQIKKRNDKRIENIKLIILEIKKIISEQEKSGVVLAKLRNLQINLQNYYYKKDWQPSESFMIEIKDCIANCTFFLKSEE